MALKIRLSRGGTKKRPIYAIVVADSKSPRDGRFIEKLGYYNPMLPREHADRLKFDADKAKVWVSKGALPTERVHRFLADAGVMAAPVRRETPQQSAPKAKAQERAKAAAAAAAAPEAA